MVCLWKCHFAIFTGNKKVLCRAVTRENVLLRFSQVIKKLYKEVLARENTSFAITQVTQKYSQGQIYPYKQRN